MKKTQLIIILIALTLIAFLGAWIVVNHQNNDIAEDDDIEIEDSMDATESDDEELIEKEEGNGIAFDEEGDGAVVETVDKDTSEFFGDWEATSDMGQYLYGSIEITVKENGTWKGEITGEPLKGTWEDKGDHLHMNNEIFSFDLAFSDSGNLVLIDTDSDDIVYTVLTKKQ